MVVHHGQFMAMQVFKALKAVIWAMGIPPVDNNDDINNSNE